MDFFSFTFELVWVVGSIWNGRIIPFWRLQEKRGNACARLRHVLGPEHQPFFRPEDFFLC
jgi:hypothetical protein